MIIWSPSAVLLGCGLYNIPVPVSYYDCWSWRKHEGQNVIQIKGKCIWSQSVQHFFPSLKSASSDQHLTTTLGGRYFSIMYKSFRNLVFRFFVCSYWFCRVFNIVVPHEQKDQKISSRDPLMPLIFSSNLAVNKCKCLKHKLNLLLLLSTSAIILNMHQY